MALMTGALASGCASQSPVRQHPELADAARRIKTVAILPPDVAHERVVFSGDNERLTERERCWPANWFCDSVRSLKTGSTSSVESQAKNRENPQQRPSSFSGCGGMQ